MSDLSDVSVMRSHHHDQERRGVHEDNLDGLPPLACFCRNSTSIPVLLILSEQVAVVALGRHR